MKCEYGALVETDDKREKREVLEEKPVPIQHFPPQITNELGCDQMQLPRLQPPNNHLRHDTAITSAM
jgi:hypothetical protein